MLIRAIFFIALLSISASAQAVQMQPVLARTAKPAYTTAIGYFHEYALDHIGSGPAIVTIDEQDSVWVALAKSGKLARFANGTVDLFEIGAESRPVGLIAGTKANGHPGAIWIAASYDNKLIRFDIATGQKREYKITGDDSWPFNIAIAPDGAVWFTERASSAIGRLDPTTGEVKHYQLPTEKCGPAGLAIDPRSGRIWFTASYADRIGTLDPATGQVREFKMGDTSTGLVTGPAGLALDGQGGVWFAKLEGKIGHIAPGSDEIQLIDTPREALRPAGLTVGPNGDVWVVALDGNLLLRYQPPAQTFTLYPLPIGESDERPNTPPFAKTSRPFGIATDRQGNVWFSQQYTGQLGVLDITPPALRVLSPGAVVRTASVPLTVLALDRVSGVKQVNISLDGKPVALKQGRLDLCDTMPGRHKLEAVAVDGAGHKATATVEFDYAPSQIALLEALQRLQPVAKSGEATKATLLAVAQDLSKGDVRAKLDTLRKTLLESAKQFRPSPSKAFEALVEFQMKNAGQVVEVRILDTPANFSATEITVRKGDTIRWKYDPPSDGHSISHNLHRIEIDSLKVRSGLLKAGESFSYRFEQPGQFLVKDSQREGASLIIKVVGQ